MLPYREGVAFAFRGVFLSYRGQTADLPPPHPFFPALSSSANYGDGGAEYYFRCVLVMSVLQLSV